MSRRIRAVRKNSHILPTPSLLAAPSTDGHSPLAKPLTCRRDLQTLAWRTGHHTGPIPTWLGVLPRKRDAPRRALPQAGRVTHAPGDGAPPRALEGAGSACAERKILWVQIF